MYYMSHQCLVILADKFLKEFPNESLSTNYTADPKIHPEPHEDSLLAKNVPKDHWTFSNSRKMTIWKKDEFVFGFRDRNQMEKWLGSNKNFHLYLGAAGYKVQILSGVCYYGSTQAIIHKESSTLLDTIPLAHFLS